ncbi:MAG: tetratricopeptide repeat protein, partial [Pseudomonadota bacterium]
MMRVAVRWVRGERGADMCARAVRRARPSVVVLVAGIVQISIALAASPQSEAYLASAQSYIEKGDIPAATIELKNSLQADPDNLEARLHLAELHLISGDYLAAEKEAQRVHEVTPSDRTEVLYGEAMLRLDQPEQVLALVQPEAKTDILRADKLQLRGAALLLLKRYEAAAEAYRQMLALVPGDPSALFGLARVASARSDLESSDVLLDRITAARPAFGPAWMLKGKNALARGAETEGSLNFNRAVIAMPEAVEPLVARARVALMRGQIDAAEADAERVRALAVDRPISGLLDAAILYARGEYGQADDVYATIARELRGDPSAQLLGGMIKMQRGQLAQAEQLIYQFVRNTPDHLAAQITLAELRVRTNRAKAAREILEPLLKRRPRTLEAQRLLASALLRQRNYTAAAEAFRRTLALTEQGTADDAVAAEAMQALVLLGEPVPRARISEELDTAISLDTFPAGLSEPLNREVLHALEHLRYRMPPEAGDWIGAAERRVGETPLVLTLKSALARLRNARDLAAIRVPLEKAVALDPGFLLAHDALDELDRASRADD